MHGRNCATVTVADRKLDRNCATVTVADRKLDSDAMVLTTITFISVVRVVMLMST